MQTVKHSIFGVGEVIGREVKENSTYITVRFNSGKEIKFAIPDSFTLGIMVADGDLKDEVETAIAKKRELDRARSEKLTATPAVVAAPTPSRRRGRTPSAPVKAKSPVEDSFEQYLIGAGYSEYSNAGNRSTVYAYTRAVKRVLKEEGYSWHALQRDIDNIIPLYDIGGIKHHIGADGNDTVIDSLKRFREFVNP